ncbi:type II secretion system F family protein [Kitasatospora sp. NPDC093679]|uniref:type II secretion system F family protein n=1 Tax=Kitasatospora sp. NPDC093679 TaxID=3154983 RepID=UPI003437CEB7
MILTLLAGGTAGAGLALLVWSLVPRRVGAVAALARIDALRASTPAAQAPPALVTAQDRALAKIGPRVAAFYTAQGWTLTSLRTDLALLEKPMETFLAQKVLYAGAGFLLGPLLAAVLWMIGITDSPLTPLWLSLVFIVGCFFAPDTEVRSEAKKKRAEFKRIVSTYLTLVHLNLAGGSGLPEALKSTAEASDTWPMLRIRRALDAARLTGLPYWAAPGRLGQEVGMPELVDLSATVSLVAEDGAKIRQSLKARAETLRKRELAELEGAAAAKSQSMLVAQLLLCFGFLIFLGYPALTRVMAL